MEIRHASEADLPKTLEIYSAARKFMAESGNPDQWGTTDPAQEKVEADIAAGNSYVCEENGKIAAVFFFAVMDDPTYRVIREGSWLDHEPYGVVHRIAVAEQGKQVAAFCLEWCLAQCGNVRIDTHRNNRPMQRLLTRLGYSYCGMIDLEDNRGERMAYQKRLVKNA